MLERVKNYTLYIVIFLLPLVVVSQFANAFFVGKLALLTFGVAIALLLWTIGMALSGKAVWGSGKFDLPVALLMLSYLVSSVFATPNKMEAFFLPGGATIVLAGGLLYFLINQLGSRERKTLSHILFLSATTYSLTTLLSVTGVFSAIPQLPEFVKQAGFTALGGQLPTAIFLGSILPLGVFLVLKQRDPLKRILYISMAVIMFIGLVVSVRESMPGRAQAPRLMTFNTSWNVAVDTLQASPLLGSGPGNYLTAFNRFRTLSYNQTDLWNLRFTAGRNYILTVMTETGLVGTFALAVFLIALYRVLKTSLKNTRESDGAPLSLLVLLVLVTLLPAAPFVIVLLFILLALNSHTHVRDIDLGGSSASRVPAYIVSLPLIVALVAFFYFGGRALVAEAKFKTALDSLAANDGRATYDTLREAINGNPYVDRYHATYSQVNLALAQNIALNEEITDEQRQTIAALIQQAIREAKAVATLNVARAGNWEVLARTYQAIIAFAEGADQFALQSYNQAIALDPIDPNLRIALGGLYYALGNYDQAINVFQLAVVAKPDLANAHYNLAIAYRERGNIEQAIQSMTNVLALVERDSADFELATEVMNALEERRAAEAGETANLTTPEEAEQVLQPPLPLPEDSQPPATGSSQNQGGSQ